MKNITALLILAFPCCIFAQNTSGEVTYDQVVTFKFDQSRMPEHSREMMKSMPKEHKFKKQLIFTSFASVFKAIEEEESEELEMRDPGMHMKMRMERPNDVNYIDLENNRTVQQREAFGRTFLIKDSLNTFIWKISAEQKDIAGYSCMKATTEVDSEAVEAWFTLQIPVSAGPEGFGQLPGLILEMSLRDGSVVYTASSVKFREVDKKEINEPTKGKSMSLEEFRIMMKEKREEMREMRGGNGPGGGRGDGSGRMRMIISD